MPAKFGKRAREGGGTASAVGEEIEQDASRAKRPRLATSKPPMEGDGINSNSTLTSEAVATATGPTTASVAASAAAPCSAPAPDSTPAPESTAALTPAARRPLGPVRVPVRDQFPRAAQKPPTAQASTPPSAPSLTLAFTPAARRPPGPVRVPVRDQFPRAAQKPPTAQASTPPSAPSLALAFTPAARRPPGPVRAPVRRPVRDQPPRAAQKPPTVQASTPPLAPSLALAFTPAARRPPGPVRVPVRRPVRDQPPRAAQKPAPAAVLAPSGQQGRVCRKICSWTFVVKNLALKGMWILLILLGWWGLWTSTTFAASIMRGLVVGVADRGGEVQESVSPLSLVQETEAYESLKLEVESRHKQVMEAYAMNEALSASLRSLREGGETLDTEIRLLQEQAKSNHALREEWEGSLLLELAILKNNIANDAASILEGEIARRPGAEFESISGEEGSKEAVKLLVARQMEANFASLADGASVVKGETFTSPSVVSVNRVVF